MEKLLFHLSIIMKDWNKTSEQVDWVGSRDGAYAISWTEFEQITKDEKMPSEDQIVIVFQDGSWIWVDEYDGSPYFRYATPPKKMINAHSFSKLSELPRLPYPQP